jgi:hypothetical protein
MSNPLIRPLLGTFLGLFAFSTCASPAQAQPAGTPDAPKRNPSHQGSDRPRSGSEADKPLGTVSIGKFEILAGYTYARALRDGWPDQEAKQRGIVAAVMASRVRGANRGGPRAKEDSSSPKQARQTKPRTLSAEDYDHQIVQKLGRFYNDRFMPVMKQLVKARLTYARVKELLEIPPAIGAKITSAEFEVRTAAFLNRSGSAEGSKTAAPSSR